MCATIITSNFGPCTTLLASILVKNQIRIIVTELSQAYIPSDLDLFFAVFNTLGIGERPILDSLDGGAVQNINESSGYNGESDLDLEYAMTLMYPQPVTLY